MAIRTKRVCHKCFEPFVSIESLAHNPLPPICPKCMQIEENEELNKYFADLDMMTLEQRVRKLEEWIYNHNNIKPPGNLIG